MAVTDDEEMVRDARAWLAEAEATLAICIDRRDRGEPFPVERTAKKPRAKAG